MKKILKKLAVLAAVAVLGVGFVACSYIAGVKDKINEAAPDYSSFIPKDGISATFSHKVSDPHSAINFKVYFYADGTYISSNPNAGDGYGHYFEEPECKGTWKFEKDTDSFESGKFILKLTHWFDTGKITGSSEVQWKEDTFGRTEEYPITNGIIYTKQPDYCICGGSSVGSLGKE